MVNTLEGGVFQGFLSLQLHPGTRDFESTYLHEFLLPGVQISHGSRLGYVLSNPSIGHMISHRFLPESRPEQCNLDQNLT